MKKAIYFPLNTAHYSSVKSLNIRMKYDFAGYAIYVMTLQKLAEATNRTLSIEEIPALAFDFRCNKTLLQSIIDLGFDIDGNNFYSTELNESLAWYDAKHNASSEGGKKAQAQFTPDEKSERGKKLAEAKKQKAQAKRDKELEKELEEQAQAENYEIDENSNNNGVTTEYSVSNNEVKRSTPLSDTDNRNINVNLNVNREKIEIEKEENVNGNKIEIETKPSVSDLGLVSSSIKVYDLTPEVISIYLGETNNKKLFNVFIQQPTEFKSKLQTYHQFEKAYLIVLGNILHKRTTQSVLNRNLFIEELNTNFNNITKEVLSCISDSIIDFVIYKEDTCNKQLQFLKLGI